MHCIDCSAQLFVDTQPLFLVPWEGLIEVRRPSVATCAFPNQLRARGRKGPGVFAAEIAAVAETPAVGDLVQGQVTVIRKSGGALSRGSSPSSSSRFLPFPSLPPDKIGFA